jgi:hypothetical protein
MLALLRTVHVLSLAVWLGSVVFFTIAGVLIFRAFEDESAKEKRLPYLPVPEYTNESPPEGLPGPRAEQGSRLGGVAVGAIFPVYFGLQTGCAALAVLTGLGLAWAQGGRLATVRLVVCVLGLVAVLAGWWLEHWVSELRKPRNERTDTVLTTPNPTTEQTEQALEARATFGLWHGISLLVNFATLALVLLATALAGHLDVARGSPGVGWPATGRWSPAPSSPEGITSEPLGTSPIFHPGERTQEATT